MAKRNPLRPGQCHSMAGPLAGSGTHAPDGEPAALPHQRAAGPLEAVGQSSAASPTLLCLEEDAQPELRRKEYLRLLAAAKARGNRRVYLAVKVFRLPGAQCPRTALADGGGGGQRLGNLWRTGRPGPSPAACNGNWKSTSKTRESPRGRCLSPGRGRP